MQNLNFDLGHSRLKNFKPVVLAEFFTAFVRMFGSFRKSYRGIGTICFRFGFYEIIFEYF